MKYTSHNVDRATVYDVDTKEQLKQVLLVNTETRSVVVATSAAPIGPCIPDSSFRALSGTGRQKSRSRKRLLALAATPGHRSGFLGAYSYFFTYPYQYRISGYSTNSGSFIEMRLPGFGSTSETTASLPGPHLARALAD